MKKRELVPMIVSVLLTLIWFASIHAAEVKLTASDGETGDFFGCDVSISGDYAIVGAYDRDDGKGAAYIFKRDGDSWSEQEVLFADDAEKEAYFGWSVSISGDHTIIGAHYDDEVIEDGGAAYIFHREGNSWTQQAKLLPHGPRITWGYFGCSVSISGDYAVVGAKCDNACTGAIYIFKREGDSWNEQCKLVASDGENFDYLGGPVSISGDHVIASATLDDDKKGAAYIFRRDGDTWSEQTKLTASDGEAGDRFGESSSISGNYAIVGANGDRDGGQWSGSAYISHYDGASWNEQAKLISNDLAVNDCLGGSVFISGDRAIVSAGGDSNNTGSVYAFLRHGTSWIEQAKITASDGAADNWFGRWSVSISGNYAIVDAHMDDNDNGIDAGAVYIYHCVDDLSLSVEPMGKLPSTWGKVRKTELLQNFPNPFNPETWIPYSLSKSEHVIIRIYSPTGQLVRTLDLGQKPSGAYLSKEKAAYWDGKNEAGEMVASNIYFYVMEAGETTDSRKMVVAR